MVTSVADSGGSLSYHIRAVRRAVLIDIPCLEIEMDKEIANPSLSLSYFPYQLSPAATSHKQRRVRDCVHVCAIVYVCECSQSVCVCVCARARA